MFDAQTFEAAPGFKTTSLKVAAVSLRWLVCPKVDRALAAAVAVAAVAVVVALAVAVAVAALTPVAVAALVPPPATALAPLPASVLCLMARPAVATTGPARASLRAAFL